MPYVVLLDGNKLFKQTYGGGAIPRTYLLDRDGKIAQSHLGWGTGDEKKLAREIEKLLQP